MKFEFELSEAELILRALMAQPMQSVESVVIKLRQQAAEQIQAAQTTPPVEEPKAVQ